MLSVSHLAADPQLTSWITTDADQYARLYQTTDATPVNGITGAQNVVITFNPGPTYTLTGGFTIN